MQYPAVAGGDREVHQPDRLARRGAAGAGNACDRDRQIDAGLLQRADRHRRRGFLADRAERRERGRLDAEHRPLGIIGISDKAAVDHVGGARNIGQGAGDQPTGAGLRGCDRQLAHPTQIKQRAGEGARVAAAHISRSRANERWRSPSRRCLPRVR